VVAENIERAYGSPGHARYEGRGRRGQHLWLPFYPHIGKYFTGEYEYSPVNYGVCPTCITLAALGFYRAAVPIRFMPPRNALNAVLFSFEGEVSGETLANILSLIRSDEFNGLISRIRSKVENIPLSTLIYVLITCFTGSVLRRIYESKAMWAALSITFDIVKGQVVQIRGYEEFSIDRYISSLVYLLQVDEKHNIGPLDRLIGITRRLMEKDEAAAVEALYRFLNTRSHMDLYLAIRRIVKVLGEGPGKVFCEELACLTQMI
ncbi:MAG: hypothetical protein N3E47_07815, partial [Candidatus Bathyarchaeota archaeon]|nr:hypothetical protein [Candidatus Bathyarchaeota archaeon]